MTGKGISHGAITVINAMPTNIGATIGVELRTEAEYIPGGDSKTVNIVNDPEEDTRMAGYCVEEAYRIMKREEPSGWTLTVTSQIPVSRGLKSSSSACNAILHAVFDEYDYRMDIIELVRCGVKCAKRANVTVTGSFDDACGCELGGLVVTDNGNDEIISHKDIGQYDVVIHVPEKKIRKNTLDVNELHALDNKICVALSIVNEYPFKAMIMNGRILSEASGVDNSMAEMALRDGAVGAGMSGSGPAIAMVFEKGRGQAFIDRNNMKNTILTGTRGI